MVGSNNKKTLITGNGFDLAHNLPTSYKDFINFVLAFEAYKGDKSHVAFDALFSTKNSKFGEPWLEEVRQHYATEKMFFDLTVFDGKLNNAWLNYFKPIQTIETWIDFEKEIDVALDTIVDFCNFANELLAKGVQLEGLSVSGGTPTKPFYHAVNVDKLVRLRLLNGEHNSRQPRDREYYQCTINKICFKGGDTSYQISIDKSGINTYLLNQLNDFIMLFENYLKIITNEFYKHIKKNMLNAHFGFDEVFTLNYTKTVENLYANINASIVYHLHGEIDNKNNIVLGVSNVDANALGVQALGFTKYYQTLFKSTNFGFLDEADCNTQKLKGIDYFVWGHSLDNSDEKYIKRLFDEISFELAAEKKVAWHQIQNDRSYFVFLPKSTITIYFHDESSKAKLLKNLLVIIGEKVIEKSIRLKYLKFSPAPKIWKDQLVENS